MGQAKQQVALDASLLNAARLVPVIGIGQLVVGLDSIGPPHVGLLVVGAERSPDPP